MAIDVRNDLTVVKIYFEGNTYEIWAEDIDEDDEQTINEVYASNSKDPYEFTFGQCKYSIKLSGVAVRHKQFFNWIRERQRSGNFKKGHPNLMTFEYVKNKSQLTTQSSYRSVFVKKISRKNSDLIDVEMIAGARTYRNANNDLI